MSNTPQLDNLISFLDMNYNKNVLYIDDEQHNLTSFKSNLRLKYKIHTATNEKEAFDILAKNNIDEVFSDYKMPKTNGVQIITKIKEMYPRIKAALVSAYTEDITTNKYPVFDKPLDFNKINSYLCGIA